MRKVLISLLALVIIFCCSFSLFAVNLNSVNKDDEESLNQFLSERTVPEDFIHYDEISFLGDFVIFRGDLYDLYTSDFQDYKYMVSHKNGRLLLYCKRYLYYEEKKCPEDVFDYLRYRFTSLTDAPEEDLRFCSENGNKMLTIGDLTYCYYNKELISIVWQQRPYAWMELYFSRSDENAVKELTEGDFMYQLCQRSTMEAAKEQLFRATKTELPDSDASTDTETTDAIPS
ncbi:MAG: hypothetical protein J5988_11575, partial [Eubacterium sp.]|nr:hypothetical protein [Eubacterium sp.]